MESLELFKCQGMLEAAADVVRLLVQCSILDNALSTPSQGCHGCPLNFPPPPFPSAKKRRRRRRRRRSQSPGSTASSSLSTDVDAVVTSILELPVTSSVQAELNMEELIWDDAVFIAKDERQEGVAIVEEVIDSVLRDVQSTSEGPVDVGADKEMQLIDLSFAEDAEGASGVTKAAAQIFMLEKVESAAKDEEWLKEMVESIEKLETKYAPHPLPYRGPDGFLHSADVHPPRVDFAALGFNSRRLPTPEMHRISSCLPSDGSYYTVDNLFGSKPGLLTTGGVIQMPPDIFGYQYVYGTGWVMAAH